MDPTQRETNRRNWDERAALHARGSFYDFDGFVADSSRWLHPCEPAELGDVRGKSLVQLQCHMGQDLLSWLRLGAARGVGLDFSAPAIEHAQRLAARCGLSERARFVLSDVYDAPRALAGTGPFDIVYVSVGALCWLPDVKRWAEVCAALLPPGGVLYVHESHPMLFALGEHDGRYVIEAPYFETREPYFSAQAESYGALGEKLQHPECYQWNHGLADVIGALLSAGFVLELLSEHREVGFAAFPSMTAGPDGLYRLPETDRDRIPLAYSLRARKR